jgi:hypothetical protein
MERKAYPSDISEEARERRIFVPEFHFKKGAVAR